MTLLYNGHMNSKLNNGKYQIESFYFKKLENQIEKKKIKELNQTSNKLEKKKNTNLTEHQRMQITHKLSESE